MNGPLSQTFTSIQEGSDPETATSKNVITAEEDVPPSYEEITEKPPKYDEETMKPNEN